MHLHFLRKHGGDHSGKCAATHTQSSSCSSHPDYNHQVEGILQVFCPSPTHRVCGESFWDAKQDQKNINVHPTAPTKTILQKKTNTPPKRKKTVKTKKESKLPTYQYLGAFNFERCLLFFHSNKWVIYIYNDSFSLQLGHVSQPLTKFHQFFPVLDRKSDLVIVGTWCSSSVWIDKVHHKEEMPRHSWDVDGEMVSIHDAM